MSAVSPHNKEGISVRSAAIAGGLCVCLLWAYWPTLVAARSGRWASDPAGILALLSRVPLIAGVVLWTRRSSFPSGPWNLFNPWGLAFFGAAAVIRIGSAFIHIDWFDGFSLLLSLAGVVVMVG